MHCNEWNMKCLTILLLLMLLCHSSPAAYCPMQCICTITVTNCSNTNMVSVPGDINQDVRIIDLSYNQLLSPVFSQGLYQVQQINLTHCELNSADFNNLPNLEFVDLSYNDIVKLESIEVSTAKNLKTLNLANNNKVTLLGSLKSPSLEVLDLSNCNIHGFHQNISTNLPKLEKLSLRNNSMRVLTYLTSKTLSELDVSMGQIIYITKNTLTQLPDLLSLNVSFNPRLRVSFREPECISALEIIDFSATGSSEIAISSLCHLEEVNFSLNSVNSLDEFTLSRNKNLKKMNISFNNIERINVNTFANTTKLRVLDMAHNRVRDLDWTKYLDNLIFLNLSRNDLYDFNEIKLKSAVFLDVSSNHIFVIDINIQKAMPNIEYIDLSFNMINQVAPLKSDTLKTLKLSFCQITSLTQTVFQNLKSLQFLDLEGNKLSRLEYSVLAQAINLKDVRLNHNPWNCDCKSERFHSLYTFLVVNQSISNANELTCEDSGNKTWWAVCSKIWKYEEEASPFVAITTVVAFFAFSLLGMAVLIFMKYRASKIRMRMHEVSSEADQPNRNTQTVRRVMSETELLRRTISDSDQSRSSAASQPPPTYEEALLMPPLSETERMTRSMGLLTMRS